MILKSLELQGFKTFPDKTRLSFTKGITAVVGPNGSGKSNISDAMRWVLGEQSPKTLRCSKMEDVVFNGAKNRKRTGFAQVTLTIDNSDRTLDFDKDEVSVTRRYYRSGASEYLINNTVVRLQDIHELFMDTGLGRDGYSMISQGKIDSIVAAKSEDRREIFEEAAGISRYRYRKADAERRLDRTEENLVRLRDILSELEGRVEPLRIQSEKAKSYLEYAEEKRGLEIGLWLKTIDKSTRLLREQEDKIAIAQSQYDETQKALTDIEAKTEELFSKQSDITAKIETLRSETFRLDEEAAGKRAEVNVLQNDIFHNQETVSRIASDIDETKRSSVEIDAEIEKKHQLIKEKETTLSRLKDSLNTYLEKLNTLRDGESESSDKLMSINAELSKLTAELAEVNVKYMTSGTSISEISARMDSFENNIKERTSQIETLKKIIVDYGRMLSDCDEKITELTNVSKGCELRLEQKSRQCEELKASAEKLRLDSEQLFRKAKLLEDLERNLEGFAASVKTVMREVKNGGLTGIHGPVSRVISVPKEYSTAVETALGGAMQNIVTDTDADAKKAIAFLKRCNGGRATFLPIATIKARDFNERGLEQCEGFIGIASELCSCKDCYKGILASLLGRIVIAENLDCAVNIAKRYSYRFKVVTLDGQVVNAGGSLTGGSLAKSAGLLGRASEIESIKNQAQKLKEDFEQANEKLRKASEQSSKIKFELSTAQSELYIMQGDKVKIEAEKKSRESEIESTQKLLAELNTDYARSDERIESLKLERKEAEKLTQEYKQKISELESLAGTLSGSREELLKKREELSNGLQETRLSIVTTEKDIEALNADIESFILRKNSGSDRIEALNAESENIKAKNVELKAKIDELNAQANALSEQSKGNSSLITEQSQVRIELEKQQTKLRQDEREETAKRERLGGELARLSEKKDNLQNEYDTIISKLWEEYELTKREAEEKAPEIPDVPKAQRRLSELKQKIRALGSVNVSAIDEYKEVSERYEFLKTQIGDVETSKAELLKLIDELTHQMQDIFVERFALINENFKQTFLELFGGGSGELSLTDPDNVLTTGIEIKVSPPGKIVSHIELLSGGEKALVAIALYFAIMKVSPAPFCVMDEIEAALDDVNVDRFAQYLRRMNDKTQFICISHRRGTMEEADVLYGVTMQDEGISKLLELRASEIEQKLGLKAR